MEIITVGEQWEKMKGER